MEQLQTDMILACVEDALTPFIDYFFEKDEKRKVLYLVFRELRQMPPMILAKRPVALSVVSASQLLQSSIDLCTPSSPKNCVNLLFADTKRACDLLRY